MGGRWQPQLRGAQPHIVIFMYRAEHLLLLHIHQGRESGRARGKEETETHTQREILEKTGETKNDLPALQVPHESEPTFRFVRPEYPTKPSVRPGYALPFPSAATLAFSNKPANPQISGKCPQPVCCSSLESHLPRSLLLVSQDVLGHR